MGWIVTSERELINSDALKQIKTFDLENEKEGVSATEIVGVFFDDEEATLGYSDGPDGADQLIELALSRQFYRFDLRFRDICEAQSKKMKELQEKRRELYCEDEQKAHEQFNEYWKETEKEANRIKNSCTREETEVDCYI